MEIPTINEDNIKMNGTFLCYAVYKEAQVLCRLIIVCGVTGLFLANE